MRKVTVQNRQTWFDLSIQETGNVYNASAMALANMVSVTITPVPGSKIVVPEGLIYSAKAQQYFADHNITPATGLILDTRPIVEHHFGFPYEFPNAL